MLSKTRNSRSSKYVDGESKLKRRSNMLRLRFEKKGKSSRKLGLKIRRF